jgi:glycerophosphoryl diester phosphodiesterase
MGVVPLWQALALINESAPGKGILIETKHPVVAGSLVEHRLVEDLKFFGFAGKSPNLTQRNAGGFPNEKWAAVMSFSALAVKRIQRLLPNQATVFLTNHAWSLSPALRLLARSTCVGPHIALVKRDTSLLSKLSHGSHPTFVWTVNSSEDLATCFDQAVSCVITDDARLALQIRDESVLV